MYAAPDAAMSVEKQQMKLNYNQVLDEISERSSYKDVPESRQCRNLLNQKLIVPFSAKAAIALPNKKEKTRTGGIR